jgi:hypothetical protein
MNPHDRPLAAYHRLTVMCACRLTVMRAHRLTVMRAHRLTFTRCHRITGTPLWEATGTPILAPCIVASAPRGHPLVRTYRPPSIEPTGHRRQASRRYQRASKAKPSLPSNSPSDALRNRPCVKCCVNCPFLGKRAVFAFAAPPWGKRFFVHFSHSLRSA